MAIYGYVRVSTREQNDGSESGSMLAEYLYMEYINIADKDRLQHLFDPPN